MPRGKDKRSKPFFSKYCHKVLELRQTSRVVFYPFENDVVRTFTKPVFQAQREKQVNPARDDAMHLTDTEQQINVM